MKYWLHTLLILTTLVIICIWTKPLFAADTNTVSSTVVTDKSVPTANSPSVVVNNSDVCKTAVAGAVQTQILGISSGITVTDENCERMKLSRSLYLMGMKVAAISLLCSDERVFQAMFMAKTYCPVDGKIGEDAYNLLVNKYDYEMPTYKKYVELEKKKIILPKKKPKINKKK